MTTFTIDVDNNIAANLTPEDAAAIAGAETFNTQAALAKLAAEWPAERLVGIWNGIPGVTATKKFKDRKTGVSRIWKAIQSLAAPAAPTKPHVAPRKPHTATGKRKVAKAPTRTKKAPKARKEAAPARDGSKKAAILALLQRSEGASLADLMAATGWQAHSVRGFISGTLGKKMGMTVASAKAEDGERRYSVNA
jgi:Protein of unknown function (DUF3489)